MVDEIVRRMALYDNFRYRLPGKKVYVEVLI